MRSSGLLLALAVALLLGMLLGRLSHPLLWQDEGETAMFASRVLAYGYPKVHGERNVVYEFGPDVALGVKESVDAYIGKTWGDFYVAAPAVAWARRVEDPYAQTFRLRLPFALIGAAGLGVLLAGVLPAVPRPRRVPFAAAYLAACAVSVSLVLHLREVRYYALLMATLAGLLTLHLRDERRGPEGWQRRALAQAGVSFLLFQVFHVAWFAATLLLAGDRVLRAWDGEAATRPRRLARAIAPHALAAVAVAPWLWFLETFRVARGFAAHLGLTPEVWLGNLAQVALHLVRHELLVPALVCSAAGVVAFRWRTAPEAHRLALRLGGFALAYAALGCLNPLVYERYFFALGPLVTCVFLLEAFALAEAAGARRRRVAALLAGLALLALLPRAEAIRGRIAELRDPVQGPVDFLVAHLRERYPDPEALVIATNYDAHPLMFHLGSRVIVGLSGNDLVRERELSPDVVIPRRRWPRMLPVLSRFLSRGRWETVALPVRDVHFNNVPTLGASPAVPEPHHFATPRADPQSPAALRVHHRISEGG